MRDPRHAIKFNVVARSPFAEHLEHLFTQLANALKLCSKVTHSVVRTRQQTSYFFVTSGIIVCATLINFLEAMFKRLHE